MKNKKINYLIALLVGVGLLAGVSYVMAAGVWTAPTCPPPNCNTDTPVNVGISHQNKLGSLSLNTSLSAPDIYGLDVFGISRFFGNIELGTTIKPATIKIIDGNQAQGRILVSDANGVAKWTDPAQAQAPTSPGAYVFNSSYYDMMRNSEFRTWFSSFTNGSAMLKPLTGTNSEYKNNEGWGEWDAQVTADKLCNFFTNGFAIKYDIRGLGSGNNNNFYRWDRSTNSWRVAFSENNDSRDIYRVTCYSTSGVVRGAPLLLPSEWPNTAGYCSTNTYKGNFNCN